MTNEAVTPEKTKGKYHLLENNILGSILAFLGILFLLFLISSILIYFATIAIPTENKTLTNILIGSIITLTLGALIGVVTFVTKDMTEKANNRIDTAFNQAQALAVSNQNKLEALIAANQAELKTMAIANHTSIELFMRDQFTQMRVEIAKIPKSPNSEN